MAEENLATGIQLLAAAGSLPLVIKGWAAAQYFAIPHLRPFGDIDACLPPEAFSKAISSLEAISSGEPVGLGPDGGTFYIDTVSQPPLTIDLHANLDKYFISPISAVFDRARRVQLGSSEFLVPCPEDHLRLSAIHFLKDGGWRPISLCDVAAMVEAVTDDFDWDLCMGEEPIVAGWIGAAIALSHEFLDANVDVVPERYRVRKLPDWLCATVVREWEAPFVSRVRRPSLSRAFRRPQTLLSEIKARWPNPLIATTALGKPIDDSPRWPIQAKWFGLTAAQFATRFAQ